MISTRIENRTAHYRCKELGRSHREPDHGYHQAEKPFQQVYLVGSHKPQSGHAHKHGNYERRKAETPGYKKIRHKSTERATAVLELTVFIEDFVRAVVKYYTLIILSGREI